MDATFTRSGERFVLALDRRLPYPPEKVWRALTERELLTQWFPCEIEGEWVVGAPLQFNFLRGEGENLPEEELRGEVLVFDPPKLLEIRWGSSVLRCKLVPETDGCRLLFSETLGDASWGARNAAGWEICLDNLDLLLEGATAAKFVVDIWKSKFARYTKKFEPDVGPQQGMPDNYPDQD